MEVRDHRDSSGTLWLSQKEHLPKLVGGKSGSDHGGVRIESCDASFFFFYHLWQVLSLHIQMFR